MRPYPKEVSAKTPFRPCWYFIEGLKCRNDPCTFAHGQKELKFWTMERKSGKLTVHFKQMKIIAVYAQLKQLRNKA